MRRDPIYTARARELRQDANAAEKRMWSILRAKRMGGFKFRRQHALGSYIADFVCVPARLVIELDGDTHDEDRRLLDAKRTTYIEKCGYEVIRFWNHEVLQTPDGVADAIAEALSLPPRGEGWGHENSLSPSGRGLGRGA